MLNSFVWCHTFVCLEVLERFTAGGVVYSGSWEEIISGVSDKTPTTIEAQSD